MGYFNHYVTILHFVFNDVAVSFNFFNYFLCFAVFHLFTFAFSVRFFVFAFYRSDVYHKPIKSKFRSIEFCAFVSAADKLLAGELFGYNQADNFANIANAAAAVATATATAERESLIKVVL